MKSQSKTVIASLSNIRLPALSRTKGNINKPALNIGSRGASTMQALASELHQSSTQGQFEYPRNWKLISKVTAVMLIAFASLNLLRLLDPTIQAVWTHTTIEAAGLSLWEVLGGAFGSLLLVLLAAFVTNLFPSLRITPHGIGISELIGWRRISWDQIGVLRAMELSNDRYIVMIPFKGSLRPPTPAIVLKLITILAGGSRKGERGLIVSSYMGDFDRMMQLIVAYKAQQAGHNVPNLDLYIEETEVMPMVQLLLDPEAAIVRLARSNIAGTRERTEVYGMPIEEEEPQLEWAKVLPLQLLVAMAPALLLIVLEMSHNTITGAIGFWAVVLLALGIAELPFMAMLTQILGDMIVGGGQFKRPAWAYLQLQAPRVALIVVGIALVSVGMPPMAGNIAWLAGLGITTWLTVRFIQRLYYIPIMQSLLAGVGILMYQVVLLTLYFAIS